MEREDELMVEVLSASSGVRVEAIVRPVERGRF